MTYEEIMGITPGSIVPGGFSITPNATYIGPGEPILDDKGNVAPGGHYVNKWDKILVLDIGYKRQLTLIQYPVGNNEVRQGYITNSLSKIEYSDLENNFWQNGSTKEIVYLSCSGDAVLGSLNPHERAIFLYKAGDRYSVVYSTDKGPYTQSGFVKYPGGISDQITQGRCLASGGSSINDIPAGGIVPGGRTYPANAVVKNDFLYIRDKDGKIIPGRQTSIGDEITVLDISYSKQLALIQYPAGNDIRQGYVTNSTKIINYINPYQWVNGSTPETVYLDVECTREFGTIDPYESATLLYEKDGKHCVVYDAPGENGGMDMLNKNGFVHFPGNKPQATPSAGDLLYQSFPANVEKIPYGTSPLGHPLNVYKIGNGSNVLFANFAIHGFEDDWNHDGTALVNIANELIRKISATGDLHGWTVYVNNCANPDGTFNGITNDGPGRCTVTTGIDMNRCFPSGFRPLYNTRNYVGESPLGAPESIALKNIVEKIHSEHINGSNQMVVVDFHGWMGMTQGNQAIGRYFNAQFNGDVYYTMADGFFSTWAQESLSNTRAVLVEYPKNTRSIDECEHRDYAGRTYTAIMNLLADNSGNGVKTHISISGANGKIKSGTEWVNVREEPNTTSTILGQLHGNDEIKILAKVKPYGDSYYWYKIVFVKNGERLQAYVREDFVTVTGEIPKSDIPAGGGEPSKIDIAYQTVGQVNDLAASVHVRKGAGTGAGCDVVTSVNSGELLMILGEVQPGGETLPWYEIDLNGQELYIRSDFVDIVSETKLDEQGTISSSEGWVHVRKLPGTGAECTIITTLNNGVSVKIVGKLQPKGESLPWYRIKMQSGVGFIRSDFFSNDFKEFLYLLKQLYSLKENQGLSIKDINHQILTTLRTLAPQYNGTKFTILAGKDKELFTLVKNNYPHLYSLLVRFTGNNQIPIKLGNTVVGIPHLAITTECYASSVPVPSFWAGWGGDLATFCAEAIRGDWHKDLIYERMATEKSSFTLLNFYEDIDAIYFAQNINERPIYELVEYYYNLDDTSITLIRLNLLLKDIGCDNMVNLADDIYNLFTGLKGINFPFINNKHLIFIGLKEVVTTGGKYDVNYGIIKLACDALAYKIKILL